MFLWRGSMGTIFTDSNAIWNTIITYLKRCFYNNNINIFRYVGRVIGSVSKRKLFRIRNVNIAQQRSFFQSACMLGYCLFPLNVASLITMLVGKYIPSPIKLVIVAVSFIWATLCNFNFTQLPLHSWAS